MKKSRPFHKIKSPSSVLRAGHHDTFRGSKKSLSISERGDEKSHPHWFSSYMMLSCICIRQKTFYYNLWGLSKSQPGILLLKSTKMESFPVCKNSQAKRAACCVFLSCRNIFVCDKFTFLSLSLSPSLLVSWTIGRQSLSDLLRFKIPLLLN